MLKNLRLFKSIKQLKLYSYQQQLRPFCTLNRNKEIILKQTSETDFILFTNFDSNQSNAAFLNHKDSIEYYLDYIKTNNYSQENNEIFQSTIRNLVNLFSNIKEEVDKSSFYLAKSRSEINYILDKAYDFSLNTNNYSKLPIQLQKSLTLSLGNLLSSKMIISIPLLDFLINYLDINYHILFPTESLDILKLLLIINYRTKCSEAAHLIGCYVLSNFYKFDFTQFTTLIFYLSSFPLIKMCVWKYLENDCNPRIKRLFNPFSLFKLVFGFYLRIQSEVEALKIPTIKDHSYYNLLNRIEQIIFVELKDELKISFIEKDVILLILQELNKNSVKDTNRELYYLRDSILDKKYFYSLYLKLLRGIFIESKDITSNITFDDIRNQRFVNNQVEAITSSLENLNINMFEMSPFNNLLLKTPSNYIYSILFLFKKFKYSHSFTSNFNMLLSYSMKNINLKAKLELLRSFIDTKQYKDFIDLSIEPNNFETFCFLIDLIILKKDTYSKVLVNDCIGKVSLMLKKGFEEKVIDDSMKLITLFAYFSNRFDFYNNFISIKNGNRQINYDSSFDHIVFRVSCYYTEDIMRRKEKNSNITEEELMILDAFNEINIENKGSLRKIDINKCLLLKSFVLYNDLSKSELESIFSNKIKLV